LFLSVVSLLYFALDAATVKVVSFSFTEVFCLTRAWLLGNLTAGMEDLAVIVVGIEVRAGTFPATSVEDLPKRMKHLLLFFVTNGRKRAREYLYTFGLFTYLC